MRDSLVVSMIVVSVMAAAVQRCGAQGASAPAVAAEPAAGASPAAQVSEARLMDTLRSLPTKRAPLGDDAHRAGLKETEQLLVRELRAMGYAPTLQPFKWSVPGGVKPAEGKEITAADITYNNIIVDIPGTEFPNEVLIISGHFDAVVNSPGADDDGTGTAAVIELARVFKDVKPRRTLRLALFNLEEQGLVGSRAYVVEWVKRNKAAGGEEGDPDGTAPKPADPPTVPSVPSAPLTPREKIIGMVSLEMLGYFSDAPNSQKSPIKKIEGVFEAPTVGDTIVLVGIATHQKFSKKLAAAMQAAAPDLKITALDFMPIPIPDMMRSDHQPFIIAGQPAVMLTDTANFRNPNYHKPTDTIETIDAKRFTLVVKAVAGAAWELTR